MDKKIYTFIGRSLQRVKLHLSGRAMEFELNNNSDHQLVEADFVTNIFIVCLRSFEFLLNNNSDHQ